VLHVKLDGRNKIDKAVQFHLNHISKTDLVLLGHMHSYGEIEMECEISSPNFQASESVPLKEFAAWHMTS
jgi:hypothetical protein